MPKKIVRPSRRHRKPSPEAGSFGPAGPAKSLITGKVYAVPSDPKKPRLERRFDALERQYEK